jgi:hypothetical protein
MHTFPIITYFPKFAQNMPFQTTVIFLMQHKLVSYGGSLHVTCVYADKNSFQVFFH